MRKYIIKVGVILLLLLTLLWFIRRMNTHVEEGFLTQSSPYVLKRENEVYDSFYVDHYDKLFSTVDYTSQDIESIETYTIVEPRESIFLDIGCGTGELLKKMEEKQWNCFGVDKSQTMVNKAKEKVKSVQIDCNDVLNDPMLYENKTFSHIVCSHFTLYEIEDKAILFKHCYHWLQGDGYLIVHLLDPKDFKRAIPSLNLSTVSSKVKKSTITNNEFKYRNDYKTQSDSKMLQIETFTDNHTGHVRKNEKLWYMESKESIMRTAQTIGFTIVREIPYQKTLEDSHQYLVIMVKPLSGSE